MVQYLKNKARNIIHLIRYGNSPLWKYQESLDPVKYNWLKKKNIKTVIDIGACDGDFVKKFRSVFPDAMVYSFEPNPESFRKLNLRFPNDKKIKTFELALSHSKGEIDFFISEHAGSSSMLEMDELHKINFPITKNIFSMRVKSERLDEVLSGYKLEPTVLMKLDVQGAEKIVLEGAIKTLEQVDIIYCEINFQELYKGAVQAHDLILLLKNYRFNLAGIENLHQSFIDGSFLHGDAIFVKEK